MPTLSDYFDVETIRRLEDVLTEVSRMPVRMCHPDRRPVVTGEADGPSEFSCEEARQERYQVPVLVEGQPVGCLVFDPTGMKTSPGAEGACAPGEEFPRAMRLLGLMAGVIGRLCERENQLRYRVEELATLYNITAEFTAARDLQQLLDLVARTVVEVLKVKACHIRLLS